MPRQTLTHCSLPSSPLQTLTDPYVPKRFPYGPYRIPAICQRFNPDIDSGSIIFQREEKEQVETPTDLLSTLPVEVISYIFCHACTPIHGNRKWQRDCYPLLLGQISRRYRHYAWAISELWTTIVIQVNPPTSAAQTELLEEWLARTMGLPIDIYFEIETQLSMR
jgi:hypothetical protein